jgi:hypothetical protein
MRTIFRLSLLAGVAAVLLCNVPVFAETGRTGPESVQEAVPTPELAAEIGLPDSVEMQTVEAEPIPLCSANETLQVCRVTDPCTGQIFRDAICCPEGTFGACAIGITRDGCYTGVHAACLGIV